MPWLMLATTVPRRLSDGRTISVCTFSLPRDKYLAYYLADLVLFYATPLLTASVLYALIARKLLRRDRPDAVVRCRSSRRPTGDDAAATPTARDGPTTFGHDAAAAAAAASAAAGDTSSNVQVSYSEVCVCVAP